LVGVQTKPFELGRYDARDEDDEFGDASYNLIRWRKGNNSSSRSNGASALESNARIVEWEDGSLTLHIGASEAFEIDALNNSTSGSIPGFSKNGYLFHSHKAQEKSQVENNDKKKTTGVTVLECVAPIASRLTIRPSSLQSEAHKMLTVAVRKRTTQRAQIATIATQVDPEKQKQERIRNKTDLDKSRARSAAASGGGGTGAPRRRIPAAGSSRSRRDYLEDDEDDRDFDTTNIRALKRGAYEDDYEDDGQDDDEDDDDDGEGFMSRSAAARRTKKRKQSAGAGSSSSSDDDIVQGKNDDGDDDDDDDDEALAVKKTSAKPPPRQTVFADDEDSD
jgi:RNA polymerase-associated protein LEO1